MPQKYKIEIEMLVEAMSDTDAINKFLVHVKDLIQNKEVKTISSGIDGVIEVSRMICGKCGDNCECRPSNDEEEDD